MTVTEAVIHGTTAPGYERVAEVFAENILEMGRGGAALCAYREGAVVVDLWAGSARDDLPWQEDTVSAIFSATKGLAATCIALLHSRGLLDVDAPMAQYWPGFESNGKASITVKQALSHTAGLIDIPGHGDFIRSDGTGLDDHVRIRAAMASAPPAWEPGTQHAYHVVPYGYLAGTLVEHISGRSLVQFFDDEIGGPLGLDLRIGAPDDVLPRKSTLIEMDPVPGPIGVALDALLAAARDPQTIAGRASLAHDGEGFLDNLARKGNSVTMLNAGGGFGDGIGTARDLGRLYANLIDPAPSPHLPSAAALATCTEAQCAGPDLVLGAPSSFAVGFQRNVQQPDGSLRFGASLSTFGHGGAGGQLGFGDPENGIAVGFLRSHLSLVSPLAQHLINALYEAADVA